MEAPLISVIVTCYNYGRYVAQALDSALAQCYPNVEIVVINDGSTDDSREVLARYQDRVRVIEQPNRGHIAAYNAGFAASRGEIIVLLDADDALEPDVLSRVVAVWGPPVAKVQWDLRIIDSEGRDLGRKFCHYDAHYDAASVRRSFEATGTYRWPVSVGNAYARWFAEQIFPLTPDVGPDGALNTVAPLYGDVITLPEVLASYRVHGNNTWSATGSDASRLPARIRLRRREVALLQQHAAELGVLLSNEDVLDHELAFVNYRLMAKKLDLSYPGSESESVSKLLATAWRLLRAEGHSLRPLAKHALWFSALAASPSAATRGLMRLRFGRGAVQGALVEARARLRRSFA
ncbi:MAG: glycosyltransferase family 2 protein [Myxococcales bacterium]|nr:MAG: glycosyltransferase family 2 protein [Myxococcales bacterium]